MYTQTYESTYTTGNGTFRISVNNGTTFITQNFTYNAADYCPHKSHVRQKYPEAIVSKTDLPDI